MEKQPLVGTNGKVWLDGEDVALVTAIEVTATVNYEDYFNGFDVDRVAVSQQGEGTLSFDAYDSHALRIWEKMKSKTGKFMIEANLTTPAGKVEGVQLNGVTFDNMPLVNWTKGEKVAKELTFRHNLSAMVVLDEIVED